MIRPETLRPFAEDWQAPTADEIKEVLERQAPVRGQ